MNPSAGSGKTYPLLQKVWTAAGGRDPGAENVERLVPGVRLHFKCYLFEIGKAEEGRKVGEKK